jgi:nitrite reductase/ring-hydroxylating ferredoxin subunit
LEEFQYVAKLSELKDSEPCGIEISGELAVVVRVGERVYALGGHCPHTGMRLADGSVAEGRLICFYHGANYDLETGKNIVQRLRGGPFETHDIPRYTVRIEGDEVYVASQPDVPREQLL